MAKLGLTPKYARFASPSPQNDDMRHSITTMSTLSKEAQAESEIILNKTNIALARSRKLIQSWLANPSAESQVEEDEEDFKPENETAGIGSIVQDDEPGRLVRSRKANNDKLLEQILGKKAAQAHRRSQQTAGIAKPTQQTHTKPSKQDSSDDEEEGRASAVAQSKALKSKPRNAETKVEIDQTPDIDDKGLSEAKQNEQPVTRKTSKRKANSYLDELLAKKAQKKSKKG